MEFSFLFKYTTIYREVLKFPQVDFCKSVKNVDSHPVFKEVMKIIYNTNPDLVVDCPTTKVVFNNTIVKIDTLPAIFPRGDYKLILYITDSKSMKEFLVIQAMVTIVSSEINTFGWFFGPFYTLLHPEQLKAPFWSLIVICMDSVWLLLCRSGF